MGAKGVMGTFYHLFPLRQLWQPAVEYPMWNANWDGRNGHDEPVILHDPNASMQGPVRHLILVPAASSEYTEQVDEAEEDEDDENASDTFHLTPLGRQQAAETGVRLRELLKGRHQAAITVCTSDLTRSKETAQIVAQYLPKAQRAEPDPLLNEGR